MTSERAQAYGRVMTTIDAVGPAKLHEPERDAIRSCADALLFCEDLAQDASVRDALADVRLLLERLVESDRWLEASAAELMRELEACGPLALSGR